METYMKSHKMHWNPIKLIESKVYTIGVLEGKIILAKERMVKATAPQWVAE